MTIIPVFRNAGQPSEPWTDATCDIIRARWASDIPAHLRKSAARWQQPDMPRKPSGNAGGQAVANEARKRRNVLAPEIKAMLDRGVGIKQLAKRLHLSPATVRLVMAEHGWTPAKTGRAATRDQKAPDVARLAAQGMCIKDIARELGMNRCTVRMVATEHGIVIQRGRGAASQALPESERQEKLARAMTLRKQGHTWEAIAQAMGCSRHFIYHALRQRGTA